jgi:hypothetical protein
MTSSEWRLKTTYFSSLNQGILAFPIVNASFPYGKGEKMARTFDYLVFNEQTTLTTLGGAFYW